MKSEWRIALRWVALTASIVCAAELAVENSDARTLDQLRDLWPALSECWQPPPGSAGMEVTVRFSLKRSGAIIGEPRITYSKLWGSPEKQDAFRNSVISAIRKCTPLHISDGLGGAIAGRPLSLRFIAPAEPGGNDVDRWHLIPVQAEGIFPRIASRERFRASCSGTGSRRLSSPDLPSLDDGEVSRPPDVAKLAR
jgi:hypothetical protein